MVNTANNHYFSLGCFPRIGSRAMAPAIHLKSAGPCSLLAQYDMGRKVHTMVFLSNAYVAHATFEVIHALAGGLDRALAHQRQNVRVL